MKHTHKIALISGADLNNADQYVVASKRLSRAIRKARAIRVSNPNVILFRIDELGVKRPISLKRQNPPRLRDNNCNAPIIGLPLGVS